ncbi:MAG: hypothetical protein AB8G95_00045 [Anaerolineae bacterium]
MNDYALAKLLHDEYELTYSNPDNRENVKGSGVSVASIIVALPLAFYAAITFLF